MPIAVGQRLPDATFTVPTPSGPVQKTTAEVFGGRRVVLFAVPGAFTPTCHNQHLPSYLRQHDALKAQGIDAILCVAVNDVFVLDAWAKSTGAEGRIEFLADGSADFTRAIGLDIDSSRFGMGIRSRRYSMIVDDGVVRQLNVDEPGRFDVTGAEMALCQL
jgi:peroxiredoxin